MAPLITRYPTDTGIRGMSEAVTAEGVGRLVFVSGQLAVNENMEVTGDLAEQTELVFDRIESALSKDGGKLSDVLKLTVFLTSLEEYAVFSRVRASRFDGDAPASSAVQVAGLLLGAKIEIDAVAFIGAS